MSLAGGRRCGVVIPTLGASPWLGRCLSSLRAQAGVELTLALVHQGPAPPPEIAGDDARVVALPRPVGFAAAVDLGLGLVDAPWVAVVNDDAWLEAGWLATLIAALADDPRLAAVQGVNLRPAADGAPPVETADARIDGAGLGWNRWWQAVQIGCGKRRAALADSEREVFGVSATAAVYRRAALAQVRLPDGGRFERRLGSFYEDVELAVRLRAAGFAAACLPAARAWHVGGATAGRRPVERLRLLYGNRLLVLARLLGRALPRALPAVLARDLIDLARAPGREPAALAGIPAGWARAARGLPRFAHGGPPRLSLAALAPFRVGS